MKNEGKKNREVWEKTRGGRAVKKGCICKDLTIKELPWWSSG